MNPKIELLLERVAETILGKQPLHFMFFVFLNVKCLF